MPAQGYMANLRSAAGVLPSGALPMVVAALPVRRLLLLAALLALAHPISAGCSQGDLPCWCKEADGLWETPPAPLLPTCKIKIEHDGVERTMNVYLPPGFAPGNNHAMWIHNHGVFDRSMGDIGKKVGGWPVQGADATAMWDRLVGGKAQKEGGVIVVYPQSLGDPTQRQFFQNGYWHRSAGVCLDQNIDDVGFLEQIINTLPPKLNANENRIFLSGKSAGDILVHAALCKSAVVPAKARVAVDILGGLPEPMADSCEPQGQTNVLLIHGEKDEHLPWSRRVVLDYVPFYSKQQAAGFWRQKFGLYDSVQKSYNGGEYECEDYSRSVFPFGSQFVVFGTLVTQRTFPTSAHRLIWPGPT